MNKKIDLLFTGGYDSSFRLLQALIIEKKIVQTHHIIDHVRHSKQIELYTVNNMIELIKSKFPETKDLILPTIITHRKDIIKSVSNEKHLNELRKRMHIGDQYYWLADYSSQHPEINLELSVVKHEYDKENLSKYFILNSTGVGNNCKLSDSVAMTGLDVFKKFRFATLHITKKEMLEIARTHKFADILLTSWTCHRPTFFKKPCGKCNPCKLSIENGLLRNISKYPKLFSKWRRLEA